MGPMPILLNSTARPSHGTLPPITMGSPGLWRSVNCEIGNDGRETKGQQWGCGKIGPKRRTGKGEADAGLRLFIQDLYGHKLTPRKVGDVAEHAVEAWGSL